MKKAARGLAPPATLDAPAKARWRAVVPALERRGPVDVETLAAYCQVWVRWRQAEATLAKTGQLVRGARGRPVASPLITVSSNAAQQARALEKVLGIEKAERQPPAAAKSAKADKLVTRRELAQLLGLHMQTITKWEREGMPIAAHGGKGRPSKYSEIAVRAWKEQRDASAQTGSAGDLMQQRARRELAQAMLAEQAYNIRMRDLLPREEVEKAWSIVVAAVRTKLLALPATLADQVTRAAILEGVAGVERLLQSSVHEALQELAQMKVAAA